MKKRSIHHTTIAIVTFALDFSIYPRLGERLKVHAPCNTTTIHIQCTMFTYACKSVYDGLETVTRYLPKSTENCLFLAETKRKPKRKKMNRWKSEKMNGKKASWQMQKEISRTNSEHTKNWKKKSICLKQKNLQCDVPRAVTVFRHKYTNFYADEDNKFFLSLSSSFGKQIVCLLLSVQHRLVFLQQINCVSVRIVNVNSSSKPASEQVRTKLFSKNEKHKTNVG